MKKLIKKITKFKRDNYTEYSQGWNDCIDYILTIIKGDDEMGYFSELDAEIRDKFNEIAAFIAADKWEYEYNPANEMVNVTMWRGMFTLKKSIEADLVRILPALGLYETYFVDLDKMTEDDACLHTGVIIDYFGSLCRLFKQSGCCNCPLNKLSNNSETCMSTLLNKPMESGYILYRYADAKDSLDQLPQFGLIAWSEKISEQAEIYRRRIERNGKI